MDTPMMTPAVAEAMGRAALRLKQDEYHVRVDLIETLLGSRPTASIAKRYLDQKEKEEIEKEYRLGKRAVPSGGGTVKATRGEATAIADDMLATSTAPNGTVEEDPDREHLAVTGFSIENESGRIHLWDFQVMGFLKNVAGLLDVKIPGKRAPEIGARSQIQNLVWVFGVGENPTQRRLFLRRDDAYLVEPDGLLDRPLRAMTAQGERISIAISEQVDPPAWFEFKIVTLRGCRVSEENLRDILDYAMFQGFGQWRSSGLGRAMTTLEKVN